MVAGLALVTAVSTATVLGRARAEAARFGPLTPVVVARHDLAPGSRISADDVVVRRWPARLLPASAVERVPQGAVVTQPVLAGEPLVAPRLGRRLLPPGSRALAVPTGPGRLLVRPGDRVDVLATFDPLVVPPGRDLTETVAAGAAVVAVRADSITVAVTSNEAPRMAQALSQATITLALTGGGTFGPGG
jgi:Flp pilus assembly protein CpaB